MTVSAKTGTAAEVAAANLRVHLDEHLDVNLQDASFTCQLGRQAFAHRRAWVANDARGELAEGASRKHGSVATGVAAAGSQRVVFLFSGEGAQYVDMGRELYEDEPVYREALDSCAKHLSAFLDIDLRRLLYPDPSRKAASAAQLCETWVMQPALFAVEYALALWWVSLGVEPAAMAGHGIGEYVAACISGVFSLEDALAVIALRGKLAFGLPAGAMLAVQLAADALHLNHSLSLAAVNGSSECIVSGPVDEINRLEQDLAMQSVSCRRLATSHAFHSAMMDPIVDVFEDSLRSISLHPPCIPLLSCISGTWIREDEATDPAYWARHLRNTVRFSDCIAELGREPDQVLLEVGPGNMFSNLALLGGARANTLSSLPGAHEAEGGLAHALHTVGELWTRGAHVNWEALHLARSARRISLPTYPFEHKRFWVEPDSKQQFAWPAQGELKEAGKDLTYYRRVWKLAPIAGTAPNASDGWIIFMDGLGLGKKIAEHLEEQGHHAVLVDPGLSYMRTEERRYRIRPDFRDDYDSLIADVRKSGILPGNVVHLWPLAAGDGNELLNQALERCFFSPLFLAQAAADAGLEHVDVAFISGNMQRISDEPANCPARSVLLGPARVIPLELPEVACRSIDVDLRDDTMVKSAASILEEMRATNENAAVAYRGGERFVESLEPFTLVGLPEVTRLMQGGVYLITGGTGGIGLAVAEHLAAAFKARLVLVSRSVQVREEDWGTVENNICFTEAERKRIRKLKEIRSLGGGLLVAKGDVTDIEQMKAIVKLATEQFGGVDGVVHAAGVLDDGPLLLKTAAGAKRVLDAKVRGTLVLDEVFRDTPLHFFVLFSSISSILPAAGQVDYAAANAFLDAFAASRRGKITVVNWGGWRDAGMAARAGSLHPLLQEVLHSAPGEITCGSRLTAQTAWVLAEHRLKTDEGPRYLMPGTAFMEMAVAAFLRGARRSAIEFRDVLFIAPFMLDDGESRDVRVEVKRYPDDAADERSSHFKVFSRRKNWIEHCSGKISACALRPEKNVDRAAILGRCVDRRIVFDDRHRTRQEQYLEFGGRWHSLRSLHIGRHEGLAEIELHTQFAADVIGYRMHPALLDLATGVSLYLIKEYEDTDDLFLPISYKRLRLYSSLPAKFFSHIRWREQSAQRGPVATFDITVFDAEGYVRVEIEGFSMRRIEDRRMAIQEKLEFTGASGSQTGLPVQAEDRQGIDPHDGVRALVRILSVRLPDGVVAVAAPLSKLDERKPAASHGATGAKTSLTGETFEDAIAAWWQEMLGVKKVGPDDDFFDLGGHSLVGVRFLAAVRKAYGVDLDLDVLFEARTVRGMAEVISKLERGARES